MRAFVLVILAILVAGCFSATTPGSPTEPSAPPTRIGTPLPGEDERPSESSAWLQHRALPEILGGEPSTAVASDGTRYVVAVAGEARMNVVWRSSDDGTTWDYLAGVAREYGTNDADISVAPDGTVWVATFWGKTADGIEGPWCIAVSRSADQGTTWQTTGKACPVEGYQERPWLVAGAGETFLLHGCASTFAWCLGRTVDNTVWKTVVLPFPAGGVVSRPIIDGDGQVAVAFALLDPAGDLRYRGPWVGRSPDDGATWNVQKIADETIDGRFLQFATDGKRELVAWANEAAGGQMRIRGAVRTNTTWLAPTTLSGNGTAAMPWASGTNGGFAVTWLAAPLATHPHQVPASALWTVHVWDNGTMVDLGLPAYKGPLCGGGYTLARACGRPTIGDFISAARGADGSITVAFGNGLDNATGFNAVRIHVATIALARLGQDVNSR